MTLSSFAHSSCALRKRFRDSNIIRIPCLQHIKRKFIDCGEKDPDAKRIVELINALYQNEHKHKVGVEGWTVEQKLMHRKKYAPDILGEIKDVLDDWV